jgi:hypothetical protein
VHPLKQLPVVVGERVNRTQVILDQVPDVLRVRLTRTRVVVGDGNAAQVALEVGAATAAFDALDAAKIPGCLGPD